MAALKEKEEDLIAKLKAAEEERDLLRHEVDSLYQVTAPILNREYRSNITKSVEGLDDSIRSPWQSTSKRAEIPERGRKPPTYIKKANLTLSEKKAPPKSISSSGISPSGHL